MMRRSILRAVLSIVALAAAGSLTLGYTVSAYTDSVSGVSNSFAGAADWTPPLVSAAAVGRSSAYYTGYVKQSATYYVYANLSDSGNPASGISSATANMSAISSGSTAVALTSGSFNAGGAAYNYRSGLLTAGSSVSAGTYSYSITATDKASNVSTPSFSSVVDNTPPTASDVQSTNVSGGTVGHVDQGDTLKLTYSSTIDPYSILSAWNGSAIDIQVALLRGSGPDDSVYIYTAGASPVQIPLGVVTLANGHYVSGSPGTYVTYGGVGSATPTTMTQTGALISITLGTPSATTLTNSTAGAMVWAPSMAVTDIAGNAAAATDATQTGTVHVNF